MKQFLVIASCIVWLILPTSLSAACAIENGPHPSLIEYRKNVDTVLSSLVSAGSRANACVRNAGAENQTRRAIDRIDASINENSARLTPFFNPSGFMQDLSADFEFNLWMLAIASPRGPTKRDGDFLKAIGEKILNAVNTAGIYCAMDVLAPTQYNGLEWVSLPGKTIEQVLDALIVNHKNIEAFYKDVSVDLNPGTYTNEEIWRNMGFLLAPKTFASDILANYNTTALKYCKPPSGTVDWEMVSDRFLKLITFQWASTERGFKAWRDALTLLDGGWNRDKQLAEEKRILSAELSRQWVSGKAREIVLRNLDTYNNPGNNNDSELENRVDRFGKNIVTAISNGITNSLNSAIFSSTNTDIWVRRVRNMKVQKMQIAPIADDYNRAKALLGTEAATDMKVITDLVDLHVKLSQANKNLKIAIPKIQQLCEKQLTGVGNCRNYQE